MKPISATIITLNEEKRIEACLDSLDGIADEIIVVDSGSTDATVDICRRRGCKVVERRMGGYGAQRQYATSLTTHSYVLSIDADEVLSPALRSSLIKLKETGFSHRVYCFSRLNFFCGQPVRHSGWYPDIQTRLFDKRYANWNLRDVAEKVIFRDSVRPRLIDGDLLHYRCDTLDEYVATQKHQAALRGRVLAAGNDHIGSLTPAVAALKAFLKTYIADRGILDGAEGREISRQSFRSTLLSYKLAKRLLEQGNAFNNNDTDKEKTS